MNHNKLIVFVGLPGVGKTTLSRNLAQKYKMVYLRIDEIEQAIRNENHNFIGAEGYKVANRIALNNLQNGLCVVADAVNPIEARADWLQVAEAAGVGIIKIAVICSDQLEHKKRVENRRSEIPGHKIPTWDEIKNIHSEPWYDTDLTIDTAKKSPEESAKELDDFIVSIGLPL